MAELKFEVNNKIEVNWKDNYYKSSVQDIFEDSIGISIPSSEGRYLPLDTGDRLEAIYYNDNDVYKFNTIVKGRKINRIPIILLSIPDKFKKIQRRKFVRVPYVIYINYSKISNKINDVSILKRYFEDKKKLNKALLVDISGGGIRVKFSEKINSDDTLAILLPLENEEMIIKCSISRIQIDRDGKYECGLNFIGIDNRTREKIISFIFKLMREQRRKI